VDCPKPIVGRIIGKGGETINQLQQRSGTKMQVDQTSMPLGQPCKVMISGSPQNVALAVQMVNELINSNHSGGGGGEHFYIIFVSLN
jgi:far upstream element-binding protein